MSFSAISYLHLHFPRLELGDGLFYKWPVGLRFDLGSPKTSVVLSRATELYEAVFDSASACVVIAQDWPQEEELPLLFPHHKPLFTFACIRPIALGEPQGQVVLPDKDNPEFGPVVVSWTTLPARSWNYQAVLEGIANADHGVEPAIGSRVYFINTISNIILHMYDDHGMDAVAVNPEDIRPLYHRFNTWILDYDRHTIDQTFAP